MSVTLSLTTVAYGVSVCYSPISMFFLPFCLCSMFSEKNLQATSCETQFNALFVGHRFDISNVWGMFHLGKRAKARSRSGQSCYPISGSHLFDIVRESRERQFGSVHGGSSKKVHHSQRWSDDIWSGNRVSA